MCDCDVHDVCVDVGEGFAIPNNLFLCRDLLSQASFRGKKTKTVLAESHTHQLCPNLTGTESLGGNDLLRFRRCVGKKSRIIEPPVI